MVYNLFFERGSCVDEPRTFGRARHMDCVKQAQDAGIDNISIDLIYGAPTLTDEKWKL